MQFDFSSDQKLFQEAFAGLLSDKCNATALRKAWEEDIPIPNLWDDIAELGALGVLAPESVGGLGLSEVELILLAEEAGRYCLPEPFLEHAAVAIPILAAATGYEETLEQAVAGKVIITVASPFSPFVSYGQRADIFLLWEGNDLHLIAADAVKLEPQKSLEATKGLAKVSWKPNSDSLISKGGSTIPLAFYRAALTAAGICLGAAQQLLDMTVEYVSQRQQFGKPVGSQQAVKHHLANVAISIEHARPSVYAAAWYLSNDTEATQTKQAVSAAKALASQAADLAAKQALQCQGAIGYTVENDLNFWMKKAWVTASNWGNATFHLSEISN